MAFGTVFLILFISAVLLVYYWSKIAHSYWKRKKIPFLTPSFLFGNMKKILLFRTSAANGFEEMYNSETAQNKPFVGIHICYTPALLIRDLDIVKKVLIKDFNSFSNRFSQVDQHADILGNYSMLFIKNPEWKEVRTSITPVYTSGKIKQMFSLISEIGNELDSYLCNLTLNKNKDSFHTEIKELIALYATDVIASVAYGIKANSLQNPNGEFRSNGRKLFEFGFKKGLDFAMIFFQPKLGQIFKARLFSDESTKFLRSAINQALNAREESGLQRKDLIDILLALKNTPKKNDISNNNDMLVAQAAIFFTAGYEATSSTMSFAFYELCMSMECQTRLRNEIKTVLAENNGELTYDVVMDMEYLNMVLMEVLRLYPPLPFLDRECTAPNGYSMEPDSDFVIPKGMPVIVPNFAIQRDPKYFPNPEKFDPERFAPQNRDKIVPYSYMPFGLGPHNCIGDRFGLVQAKVGLISLLRNHFVRPTNQTPRKMKLFPRALFIQSEGGIHCEIVRDPLI